MLEYTNNTLGKIEQEYFNSQLEYAKIKSKYAQECQAKDQVSSQQCKYDSSDLQLSKEYEADVKKMESIHLKKMQTIPFIEPVNKNHKKSTKDKYKTGNNFTLWSQSSDKKLVVEKPVTVTFNHN